MCIYQHVIYICCVTIRQVYYYICVSIRGEYGKRIEVKFFCLSVLSSSSISISINNRYLWPRTCLRSVCMHGYICADVHNVNTLSFSFYYRCFSSFLFYAWSFARWLLCMHRLRCWRRQCKINIFHNWSPFCQPLCYHSHCFWFESLESRKISSGVFPLYFSLLLDLSLSPGVCVRTCYLWKLIKNHLFLHSAATMYFCFHVKTSILFSPHLLLLQALRAFVAISKAKKKHAHFVRVQASRDHHESVWTLTAKQNDFAIRSWKNKTQHELKLGPVRRMKEKNRIASHAKWNMIWWLCGGSGGCSSRWLEINCRLNKLD